MSGIADNWEELSGSNNWDGLLNPLDINLRSYIIHYGERVKANSDAFNDETISKMYGFPRFAPEDLFSNVGLENGNEYKYTVTNYIYARSDTDFFEWVVPDQSAWIGYVAVATDEGKAVLGRRDILVSWRGTQLAAEWFKDFNFGLTSASDIFGAGDATTPLVHSGFLSLYITADSTSTYNKSSAQDQVRSAVRTLVDKYKDEEISITVTGHSLGSALATLNAADLVANGYNKPTSTETTTTTTTTACMVTAMVFASPRVGDRGFKSVLEGLDNLHLLRITNSLDIVPKVPPLLLGYVHAGEELKIDTTKSTYLKTDVKYGVISLHSMETYMHGVAGLNDEGGDFELAVDRDISLLNKEMDALKTDYGVPTQWWTAVKNKSMLQSDDNASWELNDYVPDPPTTTTISTN